MTTTTTGFSSWRRILWPVHREELPRLIPMMFSLFLICFNYSVLRNLKDSIVIMARDSGAEVIPFIKVWVMLPCVILAVLIYSYLCKKYKQDTVFNIIVSFFVIYFSLFATVIFPFQDLWHPHTTADWLQQILPKGLNGFIAMYRNWTLTFFYVMCELWGCIVLNILFWGFANEVTSLKDAKRFYHILLVCSNLGTVCAGLVSVEAGQKWGSLPSVLSSLMVFVSVCGFLIVIAFRWLNNHVKFAAIEEHDPNREIKKAPKKKKKKLSIKESLHFLSGSRYLLCIALIVICYNLVINVVEVLWKDRLREFCMNAVEYNNYLSRTTMWTGIISTIMALLMSFLIRRLGWRFTALISPIIVASASVLFFIFLFSSDSLGATWCALFSVQSGLGLAVLFGGMQNCFSKASKYSLLDATKDMAFIPLDHDIKLRGKAAIDGVGSRLGKSGGSLMLQGLLVLCGSTVASAPYLAFVVCFALIIWIGAVITLSKEMTLYEAEADSQAETEEAQEMQESPSTVVVGQEQTA